MIIARVSGAGGVAMCANQKSRFPGSSPDYLSVLSDKEGPALYIVLLCGNKGKSDFSEEKLFCKISSKMLYA